jgi:ABC-type antimicrobial peptide transport system permease subunit
MALGARRSDVAAVVVRRGVRLTALGVVIGGLVALGGSQLVGSFLFRVPPRDPVTFILAAVLLLSVSLLASWLPARRAARIDPLEALRHE